MVTEAIAIASEYRDLPIAQRQESPTRPRRRFDARGLEELAVSIRTHGILEPLLVRNLDYNLYEGVAGARRLRGARMAEREFVPSRIVQLSDAEAIEAQAVENLQREEIHPLEDARAIQEHAGPGLFPLHGGKHRRARGEKPLLYRPATAPHRPGRDRGQRLSRASVRLAYLQIDESMVIDLNLDQLWVHFRGMHRTC